MDKMTYKMVYKTKSIHVMRAISVHWRTLTHLAMRLKSTTKSSYELYLFSNGREKLINEISLLKIITAFSDGEKFDINAHLTLLNFDEKNVKVLTELFHHVNLYPRYHESMETNQYEPEYCLSLGKQFTEFEDIDTNKCCGCGVIINKDDDNDFPTNICIKCHEDSLETL